MTKRRNMPRGKRHNHGWLFCDGRGFVRVVGSDGEYTWDVCDDCVKDSARPKPIDGQSVEEAAHG